MKPKKETQENLRFVAERNNLVRTIYLDTADENYILARWCSDNRFSIDFLWNATHALEKYIKCVLLINDKRTHKIGHDVSKGYRMLENLAGDLLPSILQKPDGINLANWRDERPSEFIDRLMRNGGAQVRYNYYGYVHNLDDVYRLDELVFHIRRLACKLDDPVTPTQLATTNRTALMSNPSYQNMHMGSVLQRMQQPKNEGLPAARAAFELNIRFAPDWFTHGSMSAGSAASNPVLKRRIVDNIKSTDPKAQQIGERLLAWFLKNNTVPAELKRELLSYQSKPNSKIFELIKQFRLSLYKALRKLIDPIKPMG